MPFWQQIKRCENCQHFNRSDPSDSEGLCTWEPERKPEWMDVMEPVPRVHTDGVFCDTYKHVPGRDQQHPLNEARAFLARANRGDTLPMRTYAIGEVDRAEAVVESHTRNFVNVRFLNGHYRIRYDATDRDHAGTVIGMERWGVDTAGQIKRAGATFTVHPELAEGILTKLKVNDWITLIGYPPFDGQRKQARVMRVQPNRLVLQIGRRKAYMHRRGPLAGVIDNDVFVLDTTEEGHGRQAQAPTECEATAEGHDQG